MGGGLGVGSLRGGAEARRAEGKGERDSYNDERRSYTHDCWSGKGNGQFLRVGTGQAVQLRRRARLGANEEAVDCHPPVVSLVLQPAPSSPIMPAENPW